MRKRNLFGIALCVLVMALAACDGGVGFGGGGINTYGLTLDLGKLLGGPQANRGVVASPSSFTYIMVYLTGPGDSQTHRVDARQTSLNTRVKPGRWTAKVDVYATVGGRDIIAKTARGSAEVGPGRANALRLDLQELALVHGLAISPAATILNPGDSRQFSASVDVSGGATEAVAWSVTGNSDNATTISANGLLVVGGAEAAPGTLTVRAVSTVDGSRSATATVTITSQTIWTVTFDYNWTGSPAPTTQSVVQGQQMASPSTSPARTGYAFVGWFTASSGGTQVTFPYTPTANTTLYAQWAVAKNNNTGAYYDTLAAAVSAAAANNTIELLDNITLTATYTINTGVNFTLSGGASAYSILRGGNFGDLIDMRGTGTLTLTNITLDGKKVTYTANNGSLLRVSAGIVNMGTGVTIKDNAYSGYGGGGVYVDNGASFNMSGGTISGNTINNRGGGVFVFGGAFTMSGGTINGNISSGGGGGVYVNPGASFTMSSGDISGNTVSTNGGGVYVSNTFTMDSPAVAGVSGNIHDNYAPSSPTINNVYNDGGTINGTANPNPSNISTGVLW